MGCSNGSETKGPTGEDNNVWNVALQKLRAKLKELIAKRDSQTPRVIAKGNYCSNPCYEFNLNLVNECPKCKGKVVMEYENEFTIKKEYDSDGREFEKKIYTNKACDKFEYDDSISISNEDIYFDILCIYFNLKENEGQKTNYYMMLDGDRIDFGEKDIMVFLNMYQKELLPEKNGVELLLGFTTLGKPTIVMHNQGGNERIPIVCLYKCTKCGHKYHIMQTSPFMYRDKNKDVVGEEYKKLMGELKDLYKTLVQRVFEYADAQKK